MEIQSQRLSSLIYPQLQPGQPHLQLPSTDDSVDIPSLVLRDIPRLILRKAITVSSYLIPPPTTNPIMSFLFGGGRPQPSSAEKIAAVETEMEMVSDMFSRYTHTSHRRRMVPTRRLTVPFPLD